MSHFSWIKEKSENKIIMVLPKVIVRTCIKNLGYFSCYFDMCVFVK